MGTVVVDLGCFPGGWSQLAVERTYVSSSSSRVVGVDSVRMDPLENHTFIQGDIGADETVQELQAALGDRRADVVLSDVMPRVLGLKQEDHLASMELCLQAARIAESTLHLGGWFIVRFLWGGERDNWRTYLDSRFKTVRSIRPAASRYSRGEMFFCCRGFLGREGIAADVGRLGHNLSKYEGSDRWTVDIAKKGW